jgi:hypothetical protein
MAPIMPLNEITGQLNLNHYKRDQNLPYGSSFKINDDQPLKIQLASNFDPQSSLLDLNPPSDLIYGGFESVMGHANLYSSLSPRNPNKVS